MEYNPESDLEEYVEIENQGPNDQDMTYWVLTDDNDHFYLFPDAFTLPGGATVRVWTESGENTDIDLYWGRDDPVWGNQSDTANLWNGEWVLIDSLTWP